MAVYLSSTGPLADMGISLPTSTGTSKSNGYSTRTDSITKSLDQVVLNDTLDSIPDQDSSLYHNDHINQSTDHENRDKTTLTPAATDDYNFQVESEEDLLLSSSPTDKEPHRDSSVDKTESEATDEGEKDVVNAYLTYVQLPWYTIIEGKP